MDEKQLSDLVDVSRYFGANPSYVIAGGGNTSYKNELSIWVKSSGSSLKDISIGNFAVLHRNRLQEMYTKKYSENSDEREAEVKADLYRACHDGITVRPSVETSLHEIIRYPFVVHTHPTLVNAITCSNQAEEKIRELFAEAMYVPWCDPGYILFAMIRNLLEAWRKDHENDPQVIFLQNHGVFVSGNSTDEIMQIYDSIEHTIKLHITGFPDYTPVPVPGNIVHILPAIRMLFSEDNISLCSIRNSVMASRFLESEKCFSRVSLPFIPDQIVYCKARAIYLQETEPDSIIEECRTAMTAYRDKYGYLPRIIGIRGYGIVAIGQNGRDVEILQDVFDDWMKICMLSDHFGGPYYLSERDIQFIDNWEVENYRRKQAQAGGGGGKADNKVVIVTGGAQGFGAGISESMVTEGANIVVADINEEAGTAFVKDLQKAGSKNSVRFVQTDVANASSVENLVSETVKCFGGIDVIISNAGILRAGSLDEMTPETFERMTRVNYNAYFLCAKYASQVLKLQHRYRPGYFTDIIQINSKSGLKGSNKNFAYAGSKFGGIGLTQSFAMELMPYGIKVNSICPGNFFEGPLWSDLENGLFIQYLRQGKVPGAKTLEDVKAHYEKQVPAGRGCRVSDVMKAIYYVIDQEYETGQAIPVTGGQEMLR